MPCVASGEMLKVYSRKTTA